MSELPFSRGLVASLPGRHRDDFVPPASVFTLAEVASDRVPGPLLRAMRLLQFLMDRAGQPLLFLARPEIFTHGDLMSRLAGRLGDIEDHVSLSDGSSIKLISGRNNHVFVYDPGGTGPYAQAVFLERCPEVAPQLRTQINSAFSARSGHEIVRPVSVLLQAAVHQPGDLAFQRFPFAPEPRRSEAGRSEPTGRLTVEHLEGRHDDLLVFVLTDHAIEHGALGALAARAILDAVSHPRRLVVLAPAAAPSADAEPIASAISRCLRHTGFALPRSHLTNVVLANGPIGAEMLACHPGRRMLVIDHSLDFWSLPRSFYSLIQHVTVAIPKARRRDGQAMHELYAAAFGRAPEIVWTFPGWRPSLERVALPRGRAAA